MTTASDGPEEVAAWGRTEKASHLLEAAILPALLFRSVATPSSPETLETLLETYHPTELDPDCSNAVGELNAVGMSLLHVACIHGSVECVRILLERGGSVHVRDMLGSVRTQPESSLFYCSGWTDD